MHTLADAPVVLAAQAFAALQARNWGLVATLIHPDALHGFRDQLLDSARAWEMSKGHRPPGMPDGNHTLEAFGLSTLKELEEIAPVDLFARSLAAESPDPSDYADSRPPIWTRTAIGSVPESDALAHVVYRKHVDVGRFGETEETEVVTAKKWQQGWLLLLNRDLAFQGSIRITRRGRRP